MKEKSMTDPTRLTDFERKVLQCQDDEQLSATDKYQILHSMPLWDEFGLELVDDEFDDEFDIE